MFYKSGLGQLVAASVLPGVDFAVGRQQFLFPIDQFQNYWQWRDYDVSPDGRRFVMIRSAGKPRADLIKVEGFCKELRASVKH